MAENTKKRKVVATSSLLDHIAPQCIEFTPTDCVIGDQFARLITIVDYPPKVRPAWIAKVANMPGVTCSMHIIPTESYDLVNSINKSMGELYSKIEYSRSYVEKERAQDKFNDAKMLLRKIDREQQEVFYFVCILMVTADDKDKLNVRSRRVESALASAGMRGRTARFRQEDALISVGPWGILSDEIFDSAARNMPSETIAASFPFTYGGINDGSGFIFGRDNQGGIVLIDIWTREKDRTNSNWAVLGKPGVGKSTAVKKIIANEWAQGTKVIMVDPEREYNTICEKLEGDWIDCGGGKGKVNPLQIKAVPLDDEDEEEKLIDEIDENNLGPMALHIQTLKTFFKLYKNSFDDFDLALLERELIWVYDEFNITWDTDPLTIKNEDWPIMKDLYDRLKFKADDVNERHRDRYERLSLLLESAAIGADSALFNGHTTLESNSDMIVLDINKLLEADISVLRAQYFNILTWSWNEISKNREEKVLFGADECYLVIDPEIPKTLQFLRNTSKRIRKYMGSLMVISQNVVDFLDEKVKLYGQALLDNPTYKLVMGQGENDLKSLTDLMNLSEKEQDILAKGNRGEAILVAGSKRIHLNIELAEHEPELFGKGGGK